MNLRMHYCWHDTGLMVAVTFSSPDKLFSRRNQTRVMKRDSLEEKWLHPSAQQSVPDIFPGEKWLLCCPSWHHSPKVFTPLQMHSQLPAAIPEQTLHCWCPDPTADSALGDSPVLAGPLWVLWSHPHHNWTSLLQVLDDLINNWFRCNLTSTLLICEALFVQSNDDRSGFLYFLCHTPFKASSLLF